MPVPTAYTEAGLAAYMHAQLGDVATVLGWSTGAGTGNYAEAVDEALIAYGVGDISLATDIGRLRAAARREAWRLALNSLVARTDFTVDGQQFADSQMVAAARSRLAEAESDALARGLGVLATIGQGKVRWVDDPYGPHRAGYWPVGVGHHSLGAGASGAEI